MNINNYISHNGSFTIFLLRKAATKYVTCDNYIEEKKIISSDHCYYQTIYTVGVNNTTKCE